MGDRRKDIHPVVITMTCDTLLFSPTTSILLLCTLLLYFCHEIVTSAGLLCPILPCQAKIVPWTSSSSSSFLLITVTWFSPRSSPGPYAIIRISPRSSPCPYAMIWFNNSSANWSGHSMRRKWDAIVNITCYGHTEDEVEREGEEGDKKVGNWGWIRRGVGRLYKYVGLITG